jgi:hypothetical protein
MYFFLKLMDFSQFLLTLFGCGPVIRHMPGASNKECILEHNLLEKPRD